MTGARIALPGSSRLRSASLSTATAESTGVIKPSGTNARSIQTRTARTTACRATGAHRAKRRGHCPAGRGRPGAGEPRAGWVTRALSPHHGPVCTLGRPEVLDGSILAAVALERIALDFRALRPRASAWIAPKP